MSRVQKQPKVERVPGSETPCRCGSPGDLLCTSRHLEEGRWVGIKKFVQPYITYYLCASCVVGELTSDDPPIKVAALAHHSKLLKKQTHDAAMALLGDVEEVRLGDWGRR